MPLRFVRALGAREAGEGWRTRVEAARRFGCHATQRWPNLVAVLVGPHRAAKRPICCILVDMGLKKGRESVRPTDY